MLKDWAPRWGNGTSAIARDRWIFRISGKNPHLWALHSPPRMTCGRRARSRRCGIRELRLLLTFATCASLESGLLPAACGISPKTI